MRLWRRRQDTYHTMPAADLRVLANNLALDPVRTAEADSAEVRQMVLAHLQPHYQFTRGPAPTAPAVPAAAATPPPAGTADKASTPADPSPMVMQLRHRVRTKTCR